jgi:SAM-dependent methyltransferase
MKEWIDWYDSEHTIYANARHREVHFQRIAADIVRFVPSSDATVLDYSCGEALSGHVVAAAAGKLILAEPAPGVRRRVAQRFAGNSKIAVCSLEEIAALPEASIDLAVMHSVVQYMTGEELESTLSLLHRILKPGGKFVLGDVIKPNTSAAVDAIALLHFAFDQGFFLAAAISLARTLLSHYWRLRSTIGLARYDEASVVALLQAYGFSATRCKTNIGHNQARMTFVCRPE